MPGIYVHIPFCKQACHYCDFHFSTSLRFKNEMIKAIVGEIDLRKDYLENKTIDTIYFGGGTPGILDEMELNEILNAIDKNFSLANDVEITLETNPDDVTEEKPAFWKKAGINRLSIGIQSFSDRHLKWMNRAHDSQEAIRSVRKAQAEGFSNITIDLIYGIPVMSDNEWKHNLEQAFDLEVSHISAYCLTVEKGTALDHFVKTGIAQAVNDEQATGQFLLMQEEMKRNSFIAYEISNYGKKNYFSRHNTSYWMGEWYLGVGPSAHSFNGMSRQWNISNNKKYIDAITGKNSFAEIETLTTINHYNEYIMTSLRTIFGLNKQKLMSIEKSGETVFDATLEQMRAKGWIELNSEGNLILTDPGKLFADKIASEFFLL